MILGCSKSELASVNPALTIDLAPYRCPPLDPRAAAEFRRTTSAPDGGVTKRGSQEWLDRMEESEKRKNAIGRRVVREYESCRSGDGSPSS